VYYVQVVFRIILTGIKLMGVKFLPYSGDKGDLMKNDIGLLVVANVCAKA